VTSALRPADPERDMQFYSGIPAKVRRSYRKKSMERAAAMRESRERFLRGTQNLLQVADWVGFE
jgi:hypothetical protein